MATLVALREEGGVMAWYNQFRAVAKALRHDWDRPFIVWGESIRLAGMDAIPLRPIANET